MTGEELRLTVKNVKEQIEAICAENNMALLPVIVHQGDRTFSSIEIVPLAPKEQAETPSLSEASVTDEEAPKAE